MAALVVPACGGAGGGGSTAGGGGDGSGGADVNHTPKWSTVPTITFTEGVAATVSIAGYVNDADGDALSISKNAQSLPPGVTYDQVNKQFVYDGSGAVASTDGHVLTAKDGQG